jgi:hypothetical protein
MLASLPGSPTPLGATRGGEGRTGGGSKLSLELLALLSMAGRRCGRSGLPAPALPVLGCAAGGLGGGSGGTDLPTAVPKALGAAGGRAAPCCG